MNRISALWWGMIALCVGVYFWVLWHYQLMSSWLALVFVSLAIVVGLYPLINWIKIRHLQPRYFHLTKGQYLWSIGLGLIYGLIAIELFVRYFIVHLLMSQAILVVWMSLFFLYSQRRPRASLYGEARDRHLLKAKVTRYLYSLVWSFALASYLVIFSWGHYRLHHLLTVLGQ
ncbi:hypothetical protein PVA45_08210 (plasmid) [Entomospira entomophila]|uniref:Uncharacterized protein n=1 Tax=Entomospira entomophila TaxID=2719988 RepID=A0A968KS90_9SPIO|nr:hypothetical protein [Entomospira entomophilus]NIZ41489.1 hypothetical protein [Entomospira entomophilus]WDI36323.1 hypothetical protein PVA45_08210 [Entomospira entomophilus]